ncbi:MAG: DUF167 domain-containing protein [Candidatus Omnitrophica bacterium]|nr:DUF167 domain-containing protein [Candidatus Omnitrophota bacterium]
MRISIKVKVKSSRTDVVKNPDGTYTVFLTSAPVEGKANEELAEALADEFDVAKSSVKIIKGLRSRSKLVEILSK